MLVNISAHWHLLGLFVPGEAMLLSPKALQARELFLQGSGHPQTKPSAPRPPPSFPTAGLLSSPDPGDRHGPPKLQNLCYAAYKSFLWLTLFYSKSTVLGTSSSSEIPCACPFSLSLSLSLSHSSVTGAPSPSHHPQFSSRSGDSLQLPPSTVWFFSSSSCTVLLSIRRSVSFVFK